MHSHTCEKNYNINASYKHVQLFLYITKYMQNIQLLT